MFDRKLYDRLKLEIIYKVTKKRYDENYVRKKGEGKNNTIIVYESYYLNYFIAHLQFTHVYIYVVT